MSDISPRLRRRIRRDFGAAGDAEAVMVIVAAIARPERVQASIVLAARGSRNEAVTQAVLAGRDWRDVVVNAGLAGADWEEVLDHELGTDGCP